MLYLPSNRLCQLRAGHTLTRTEEKAVVTEVTLLTRAFVSAELVEKAERSYLDFGGGSLSLDKYELVGHLAHIDRYIRLYQSSIRLLPNRIEWQLLVPRLLT